MLLAQAGAVGLFRHRNGESSFSAPQLLWAMRFSPEISPAQGFVTQDTPAVLCPCGYHPAGQSAMQTPELFWKWLP